MAFDMNKGMNDATSDLEASDIFVYSYSSATRTVEFKIADGMNYKMKIPTDDELATYVNSSWDRGQLEYDNTNPLAINYLLSNYVPTSLLTTWTSSYLNLVPFRAVFLNCPELCDHHLSSPNGYSSSIIRKILIDQQLGGIVNDASPPLSEDFIDISNKNIKRLSFRLTDNKSKTLNLYGIPIQFSIVFSSPSY